MDINDLKGIRGRVVGVESGDEREHFYVCPHCGQAVDKRELLQVVYHEAQPGHEPLKRN
jgi:hypothetical protein